MGQINSKVDFWEIQIANAERLGKDHIEVHMVTAEEEKILNSRGYEIEHIGGGSLSKNNYLIRRK